MDSPTPLEDLCPECGADLEYDEVDIGVGIMRGNPGCRDCGWVPPKIDDIFNNNDEDGVL